MLARILIAGGVGTELSKIDRARVISIPPSMSISDFVRRIKGSSSHFVNQTKLESESKFAWQREYGVFSLGGQQLDRAVAYANNQKEHHAQGSILFQRRYANERFLEPEIIHTEQ